MYYNNIICRRSDGLQLLPFLKVIGNIDIITQILRSPKIMQQLYSNNCDNNAVLFINTIFKIPEVDKRRKMFQILDSVGIFRLISIDKILDCERDFRLHPPEGANTERDYAEIYPYLIKGRTQLTQEIFNGLMTEHEYDILSLMLQSPEVECRKIINANNLTTSIQRGNKQMAIDFIDRYRQEGYIITCKMFDSLVNNNKGELIWHIITTFPDDQIEEIEPGYARVIRIAIQNNKIVVIRELLKHRELTFEEAHIQLAIKYENNSIAKCIAKYLGLSGSYELSTQKQEYSSDKSGSDGPRLIDFKKIKFPKGCKDISDWSASREDNHCLGPRCISSYEIESYILKHLPLGAKLHKESNITLFGNAINKYLHATDDVNDGKNVEFTNFVKGLKGKTIGCDGYPWIEYGKIIINLYRVLYGETGSSVDKNISGGSIK